MFWTRLSSGIVLIVIALLTMGIGGGLLAAVLYAISLIAYRELTLATGAGKEGSFNGLEIAGFLGITGYYLLMYLFGDLHMALLAIVVMFMANMLVYVVRFPAFHASQVQASFFAFMYAPVMLSFVYLTRMLPRGFHMVWLILIGAWGSDTCAYTVGMLIGKKKIFPRLSPKKSLEGCIGGVLGAAFIGALYGYFFVERITPFQKVTWIVAFICGVSSIMSQAGDLAASAIKRDHEIKDYGRLIPGHGGIMDRFDSMIVTAPVIFFLSMLMIELR